MKFRIETLDWLRGLMALSIMLYHLTSWVFSQLDSDNILGRLGVYGVSVFYILSGLSIAIVYNSYIKSFKIIIIFFVRRIFRIWPLLWVVCILTVLPQILETRGVNWIYAVNWRLLFMNATTLFGFISPGVYLATGIWSIGNEMVYYSLTPIIFYIYNYKILAGNFLLAVCVAIGFMFSSYLMDPQIKLAEQWNIYVNPFNNLFLYVMGIALYYNMKNLAISFKYNVALLISSILLFCYLPFKGDQIVLVTGIGRVVFVIISILIVFCFYKLKISLPKSLNYFLEYLGLITYGIYLLHPVFYKYSNLILNRIGLKSGLWVFGLVILFTLCGAIISYKFLELKLIRLGKRVKID